MDNRSQVIYEEAIKLYKQRKFETAASVFVKLANNETNNSSINFFAGLCLLMTNKHSLSVSFFKKVVELKKNYQQTMKSCIFLAYIYIRSYKFKEAFDVLQSPVESNYSNSYVYSLMGYLAHHNKKYKEADLYFKKCLDMDPENPLFNNNYGYNLLIWKKDFDECVYYLEKAVRKQRKNPAYLHSLGWALYHDKRYAESEKILNMALEFGKSRNQNKSTLIKKYLKKVRDKKNEKD